MPSVRRIVQRLLRDRERGYSLIEVAVVLALVGIVTATGLPRLPRMLAAYDLSNGAQQLANDLRLARMRAVTSGDKARIQFGTGNYVPERESEPGSGAFPPDGATQMLPSSVTVASAPADPTFDSRGFAVQPYTITLTSKYGETKTITVTSIGRVNVN